LTAYINSLKEVRKKAKADGETRSDEAYQNIAELEDQKSAVDSLAEALEKLKAKRTPPPKVKATGRKKAAPTPLTELESHDLGQEEAYRTGIDNWRKFWDTRSSIMEVALTTEMAALDEVLSKETNLDERAGLLAERAALEAQYSNINIKNKTDESAALIALEQKELTETQKKKLEITKVLEEQWRENSFQAMDTLAAEQARERDMLLEHQNKQLEAIITFGATQEEIEALQDAQRVEKEKLTADQIAEIDKDLKDKRKKTAEAARAAIRGTISDTEQAFANMYEASGKKIKAFFVLQKAAAIANTIMSTYEGAQKAITSMAVIPIVGGALGIALAAVIVAGGLARVATIAGLSLATGGAVPGHSPNDSADNIQANLTAGEYVQPVSTVKYYGSDVMEALRQKVIPRDILSGYSLPEFATGNRFAFATGGAVAEAQNVQRDTGRERGITINNIVDTSVIDQHLISPAGQQTLMNVISENAFALRVLAGGIA